MTNIRVVHILAEGLVQGVGFRYFVQQQAQSLNLVGWVRNRHDEKVEILAQGDETALIRLISIVRAGSSMSRVTNLEVRWSAPETEFKRFSIAPTE